ncbi:MAG: DUF58 domain-containing protein [Pseudomonadota bacterium]
MAIFGRESRQASSQQRHSSFVANEVEAKSLAERLPELLIEAVRISSTIAFGIHGRRRPGPGETFWQFRQYETTDATTLIDWRRSASSDHLYVREREWEAAHTFWLWADVSDSMDFCSHLSNQAKRDRALVLLLATADLLVRSGERVALLGLTRPTASRHAASRLAEAIAENLETPVLSSGLPPAEQLTRHTGLVLIGDFLAPSGAVNERFTGLAASGVSGHVIQVLDPAEETLPYEGRTEFLTPDGRQRWIADRVEVIRDEYAKRMAAHKDAISSHASRLGWSHVVHHTDRSAADPLLQLIMRLQEPAKSSMGQSAGVSP